MSRLEQQAAPLLSPAILGQPVEWAAEDDREIVAKWALKTAFVLDRSWEDNVVPGEALHYLYDHGSPPSDTYVWLTSLVYPPGRDFLEPALVHRKSLRLASASHEGAGYRITFSVGYVIFQVFGTSSPLPGGIEARRTLSINDVEVDDFLRQLWPLTPEPFSWPPKAAFDAATVADHLA